MDHPVISRADALTRGLKRYFTAEPCQRGHIAERRVDSYSCVRCITENTAAQRKADPERDRERQRQWRERNPEKDRAKLARYRDANRDLVNERMRASRSEPGPKRDAMLARRRDRRAARVDEIRAAEKSFRDANKELMAARSKRYRARDPEKHRELAKIYQQNNPEKRREYVRGPGKEKRKLWERCNQEKLKEYQEKYRAEHKEAKYASINKRRALKKRSSGQYTADEAKAILIAQNHKCIYCKADLRKIKKHLDHIIPLSRGGLNDKTNIQWLCAPCNLAKNAKDPIEYANEIGMLI